MLKWTQSMEEKVWDFGGLYLQSLERLENITRVMIMRPVPIDHLIMDIDMDAGTTGTIIAMGVSQKAEIKRNRMEAIVMLIQAKFAHNFYHC